jgi:hypothetical protein
MPGADLQFAYAKQVIPYPDSTGSGRPMYDTLYVGGKRRKTCDKKTCDKKTCDNKKTNKKRKSKRKSSKKRFWFFN